MTDLLVLAEAQIAEKQVKEIEAIKQRLDADKELLKIAEWLKELKDYRDARVGCEYCKHKFREQHERPCSLCKHNFLDMFEREVNADADNN